MNNLNNGQILQIFQNLSEGIIIHNKDTSIKYFNDTALTILQLSANELLGKTAEDPQWFFIDEENQKIPLSHYPVVQVLNSKEPLKNMVMGIHHTDHDIIWVQVNGVPLFDEKGEITMVVISFSDISKQKETLKLLHHKTYYHPITELPNSLMLTKRLEEKQTESSLVLLEIENFNNLTQYFGKELSHEILLFIANTLTKNIPSPNEIFHTESNQFALILYNQFAKLDYIYSLLVCLNEKDLYFEKLNLNIQMLSGISFEPTDQLITAQVALNTAIADKNIFYSLYSHNGNVSISLNNEIFWAQALRKVIKDKSITPSFQPIINNTTLEIDKYEVLMRLTVDGEIYFPNSFLEISKKVKLYKYLTIGLIEKVFEYFKDKDIPFSINLNTEDLLNEDINCILLDKVQHFHSPSNVTIEIVESEGIENFKDVNRFLNRLKVYGCKVAIDDFGSGYSNFEYILKLDADYIKLDGSLIKDIHNNIDSQDIVQTIVSFAKTKNIPTIAEFVSSPEIYETIKSLGIEYSQGFYFGKPEFQVKEINKLTLKECSLETPRKQIKQLIYASEINDSLSIDDLKLMFKQAARRNQDHGISGFIVFDGKYFLQIIEGDEVRVNKLYENIVNDKRHSNILLLGTKQNSQRDFKSWYLGYLDEDKVIQDYHKKQTGKTNFLPHQLDYEYALKFLDGIQKII